MNGPEINFGDIKAELQRRIRQLVAELAPGGKVNGAYYMPRNPRRDDRHPGSFWIRVSGQAIGAWRDEAIDLQGDVIDLVTYLAGLRDRKATRDWCMSWLGWSQGVDRKKLEVNRRQAILKEQQDNRQEAQSAAKKADRAFAIYLNSRELVAGDLVHRYLASRGIDLGKLPKPPGAIRFHPSLEHHDDDGVITEWPCMVAGMCNSEGRVVAIHRTYLKPDGSGKAPVDKPKKIWPAFKGCVVRLSKGARNLSPEQAAKKGVSGPLGLAEGIENGLAVAISVLDLRVWAAGSLANMANIPKLPCISRLIVCRDNDDHLSQADKGFERVIAQLKTRQFSLSVARSWIGKDTNDLLKGAAA